MIEPEPVATIRFVLNGAHVEVAVASTDRLLDVLRDRLGCTGAKDACSEGECGACTVLLDGLPAVSCLVPAFQARGRTVETVESRDLPSLLPLLESGATQCGACTPGVVMTVTWLLRHPELVRQYGVRELLAGNLCRCTGYDGIVRGVEDAIRDAGGSP